jgi:ABC-2 type transport system ATP-binding protein
VIQAEGLTKYFEDFLAVDGVCLNVPAGEILVLLGPNGAGKTTTVRMLTSILRPSKGWARIAGYDVVKQPDRVRASVGVLTEHHGLYGRMLADEYLQFYGQLYGLDKTSTQKRIDELLETFGLADARKHKLGEYSKGMRQKLALARALLHNPPVLLLDEPTSAMDPESAHVVRDAIRQLRSHERAMILCTHNLLEAEELADQVAIIRKGEIVISGRLDDLKRQVLGPLTYEARTAENIPAGFALPSLPDGVELDQQGPDWLTFKVADPNASNPILLRSLIERNLQITDFQEMPRSLEQVYLGVMQKRNHD